MIELSMAQLLIATLNVVFFYMTLWFLLSLIANRNDVADLAWGFGISFIAMLAVIAVRGDDIRVHLMAVLTFIWAVRLTLHITQRFLRSHQEDRRYRAWREAWHPWVMPRSYSQVFLLQGLLMVVIAYPFIHAARFTGEPFGALDLLGLVVWLTGFFFEVVGDRQLRTFLHKPENKGRICDTGLWKYTRHPNYFGEALLWWGVGIMALSVPWGFLALIGPISITFLLLKVSGVPLIERESLKTPAYRDYASRTPRFVPRIPWRNLWKLLTQGRI